MATFHCGSCNYEFESDKMPKRCPYCGRFGSARREKNAEEIIRDVNYIIKGE